MSEKGMTDKDLFDQYPGEPSQAPTGMTDADLFGQAPRSHIAPPPLPHTSDEDLLTRAVLSEGDPNNPKSWQNIAGVIKNRMVRRKLTAAEVLSEPDQFESYGNGKIQTVDPTTPQYAAARAAIQPVLTGQMIIPYDQFQQPDIVASRGSTPPFDPKLGTKIGSQVFYDSTAPKTAPPAVAPPSVASVPPTQTKYDDTLGFVSGLVRPLDNLSYWGEKGLDRFGVPATKFNDWLSQNTGIKSPDQNLTNLNLYLANKAKEGTQPGLIGNTIGSSISGAPVLALTKNPFLVGGALGLSNTNDPNSVSQTALDAGLGALGGKFGDKVIGGISNLVAPTFRAGVQTLLDHGVNLTPGQLFGGWPRVVEDTLKPVPIVGHLIDNAQNRSLESFTSGVVNSALGPIGEKLPVGITGRTAINYAQQKFGDAFKRALNGTTTTLDPEFNDELVSKVRPIVSTLTPDGTKQFNTILKDRVLKRFNGSIIDDKTLQSIDSELGTLAREFAPSSDANQRKIGTAISSVQEALRGAVARQNPEQAAELNAARTGYAILTRAERAANSPGAKNGVFTGNMFAQAVKAGDTSVRDRAYAAGNAFMQPVSDAAQNILPHGIAANNNTPGHVLMNLATGAALEGGANTLKMALPATATGLLAAAPYTKLGGNVFQTLATARYPWMRAIAPGIDKLHMPAILAGSAATADLRPATNR